MYVIIDNISVRMGERFDNIKDLEFLVLVNSDDFEMFNISFPNDAFNALKKIYGDVFDFGVLKIELEVLYADRDSYKRTLPDLLEYFLISKLDGALPQVFKLLELCICIPATSAAVERSFSALKRIHTFISGIPKVRRENLT
uniref:HAT C-terminal dimerisation domain-containing protein n=1 Tax=Cacopsylla melanoneura TaxID=428564 RepID=A0A8D8ZI38_9HEMI